MSAYCVPVGTVHDTWEGTVLGLGRGDYAVWPQHEGGDVSGTTLFCFMAVLPGSAEQELWSTAKTNKGSIFACDTHAVYQSGPAQLMHEGLPWQTWANTQQFIKVWAQVFAEGHYKKSDFTVKVDPDSVMIPGRLRAHLSKLRPPADKPIYIKNSAVVNGFIGAIEVISRAAMDSFADGYLQCKDTMPGQAGEDAWLKGCLDAVGAGFMTDADMLRSPNDPLCSDPNRVTFHPHKHAGDWDACWARAVGDAP